MQRGAGRSEGRGRLYDSGTRTYRLPSAQRFSSHFSGADLRRYFPCTRDAPPASTWGLLRLPASVFLCFVTVPLWAGAREDKATGAELAAKGVSSYCERHLILNARRYHRKSELFVHSNASMQPLWIGYNRSWMHRLCTLFTSGPMTNADMAHGRTLFNS